MQSPKTGATSPLPRPHKPRNTLKEMFGPGGQGPGESEVPSGARKFVQGLTRHIKLPRARR